MFNLQNRSLDYRNGILHFHSIPLSRITDKVETPFYLYSQQHFLDNYMTFEQVATKALSSCAKSHLVCYALKANSHPRLLSQIAKSGAGADIVSGGELIRALESGFPAEKIVFSGVGKTPKEIRLALTHQIYSFNVESLSECIEINQIAKELNLKARIALRLNPDVEVNTHKHISTGSGLHKFGMPASVVREVFQQLQSWDHLQLVGVSVHIGSQLTDISATLAALEQVMVLMKEAPCALEFLDVGGGLGIDYHPDQQDKILPVATYMESLKEIFRQAPAPKILFEPGRFIAAKAGVLVSKVLRLKEQNPGHFVVLDAGMNDLIRPSLYEAYHHILPLKETSKTRISQVVGPVCESTDIFAKDRELAAVEQNDYVIFCDAGAYGKSMASTYNLRPLPDDIFIEDFLEN